MQKVVEEDEGDGSAYGDDAKCVRAAQGRQRWVLDVLVEKEACEELVHLHRSNAVAGYRDRFSVVTPREPLAADNWGHLMPLLRLRDRLRNVAEELTGEHFGLFVEWTGLSCWHAGSSIPPHYDSNRPYLAQRHYSVVVYLNEAERDFDGGIFQFFDDDGKVEEEVHAAPGRALVFSSGPENVHGVTPITRGERYTFTIWLTRNEEASEDRKILDLLPVVIPDAQVLTSPLELVRVDESKLQFSTQPAHQGSGFHVEAELLKQLNIEILSSNRNDTPDLPRSKRRRTTETETDEEGHEQSSSQADEEARQKEEVLAKWDGEWVPCLFPSVRRAIEVMAFVTWRHGSSVSEARPNGEDRTEWWGQRLDEWLRYRRQLDCALRRCLPEWKATGCLFMYDKP